MNFGDLQCSKHQVKGQRWYFYGIYEERVKVPFNAAWVRLFINAVCINWWTWRENRTKKFAENSSMITIIWFDILQVVAPYFVEELWTSLSAYAMRKVFQNVVRVAEFWQELWFWLRCFLESKTFSNITVYGTTLINLEGTTNLLSKFVKMHETLNKIKGIFSFSVKHIIQVAEDSWSLFTSINGTGQVHGCQWKA